jgi:tetratricopeptide (TPR) repeat protein
MNLRFHLKHCAAAVLLALALPSLADDQTNDVTPAVQPVTARDFFNAGTEQLAAKKYTEAEQMFESALAAQDAGVQPPALYNLAHARFADGMAALKKGPSEQSTTPQGNDADSEASAALQRGATSLAENDMSKLISAYMDGLGARHDVRGAEAALRLALETYGETLRKWQQSDDDFKSAAELNPNDDNAARNAKIVEEYIARLVDSIRRMQQMAAKLGSQHKKLDEMLKQIGGRIPKPNLPPGAPGDEQKEDGLQPKDLQGMEEGATRTGGSIESPLSRDQASQLLNSIPLDTAQSLNMNENPHNPAGSGLNW